MNPKCKGQKFEHNFTHAGGNCLLCGISQNELSYGKPKEKPDPYKSLTNRIKRLKNDSKRPPPHQRAHEVNELCKLFKESVKDNFGKWLGVTKLLPINVIYNFRNQSKKNGTPPKALFLWLVRDWKKKNKVINS